MPPRHPDAIIPPPEDIVVPSKRVACDGGGGALGHPLVYMDMGGDDFVECAY
ncbi:MAG: zinc-finger domain-containing protein, partial [Brevundimonas sp.]